MFMMFKKYNINPELSKYMIEENKKWSKKYSTKSVYENAVSGQNVNNLVKFKKFNFNNNLYLFSIIFTSFITFFVAKYNFKYFTFFLYIYYG
jgi:hypothetical protein